MGAGGRGSRNDSSKLNLGRYLVWSVKNHPRLMNQLLYISSFDPPYIKILVNILKTTSKYISKSCHCVKGIHLLGHCSEVTALPLPYPFPPVQIPILLSPYRLQTALPLPGQCLGILPAPSLPRPHLAARSPIAPAHIQLIHSTVKRSPCTFAVFVIQIQCKVFVSILLHHD